MNISMNKNERDELGHWLLDGFQKHGGLISQRHAACILGISDNSVKVAGEKGRLQVFKCGKVKMYSFQEVIAEKTKKLLSAEAEKAGRNKDDFIQESMKSFESVAENLSEEEMTKFMEEFSTMIETGLDKFVERIKK